MYDIILSYITAFLLTFFAIPSIITIAEVKRLMDEPGERHAHTTSVPTLGGIAIFAGLIFSITFWTPFTVFSGIQYILCSLIIIFLIGAKDDIVPLTPAKKFLGEIAAAAILVAKADIRITSFYGIFGIYDLPEWISIAFTVFTIILIINAFNLIDGINGLSGSIGLIICWTFCVWFYAVDRIDLAILGLSLAGALTAFLKYNYTPAKIFMGDTGSLLIGLVCSILTIKFIELNKDFIHPYAIQSSPAVAMAVLIIPLFDTLRVFTLRALERRSPFSPDRNHIHHMLLDIGLSHMQATSILVVVNISFIILAYLLQNIGSLWLILIVLFIAIILSSILQIVRSRT